MNMQGHTSTYAMPIAAYDATTFENLRFLKHIGAYADSYSIVAPVLPTRPAQTTIVQAPVAADSFDAILAAALACR